jgi:hypothetical protein
MVLITFETRKTQTDIERYRRFFIIGIVVGSSKVERLARVVASET